ncbi:MAG: hypothetical protein JSR39_06350 [Verrucomicrobia bacterium]|nr:hypothetical protein [Verrucomicrobiota bacterium]
MDKNEYIDSIKHERVVYARSLHSAKERLAQRRCLVEGKEQLRWVMESPSRLECVFAHDKTILDPFISQLRERGVQVFFVSDGILKKIVEKNYLIPFIGIAHFPNPPGKATHEMVVVLDGVKDLGNLGTIIRTGKAFGIDQFFATDAESDCFYQKSIDASRGTVFSTYFHHYSTPLEAVDALKKNGYQIVVTTPHESQVQSLIALPDKPLAVVFGNETHGVSNEVLEKADVKLQIPMNVAVESLNVGVAAGISLYELKIKITLSMLSKKIQESYGRDLFCTSRWVRSVFDHLLKESTPLNAESAIVLMMLNCEGKGKRQQLISDAGAATGHVKFDQLIAEGYLIEPEGEVHLTERGQELLAKIWALHERAEEIALNGFSEQEKDQLKTALKRIQGNCSKIIPYR